MAYLVPDTFEFPRHAWIKGDGCMFLGQGTMVIVAAVSAIAILGGVLMLLSQQGVNLGSLNSSVNSLVEYFGRMKGTIAILSTSVMIELVDAIALVFMVRSYLNRTYSSKNTKVLDVESQIRQQHLQNLFQAGQKSFLSFPLKSEGHTVLLYEGSGPIKVTVFRSQEKFDAYLSTLASKKYGSIEQSKEYPNSFIKSFVNPEVKFEDLSEIVKSSSNPLYIIGEEVNLVNFSFFPVIFRKNQEINFRFFKSSKDAKEIMHDEFSSYFCYNDIYGKIDEVFSIQTLVPLKHYEYCFCEIQVNNKYIDVIHFRGGAKDKKIEKFYNIRDTLSLDESRNLLQEKMNLRHPNYRFQDVSLVQNHLNTFSLAEIEKNIEKDAQNIIEKKVKEGEYYTEIFNKEGSDLKIYFVKYTHFGCTTSVSLFFKSQEDSDSFISNYLLDEYINRNELRKNISTIQSSEDFINASGDYLRMDFLNNNTIVSTIIFQACFYYVRDKIDLITDSNKLEKVSTISLDEAKKLFTENDYNDCVEVVPNCCQEKQFVSYSIFDKNKEAIYYILYIGDTDTHKIFTKKEDMDLYIKLLPEKTYNHFILIDKLFDKQKLPFNQKVRKLDANSSSCVYDSVEIMDCHGVSQTVHFVMTKIQNDNERKPSYSFAARYSIDEIPLVAQEYGLTIQNLEELHKTNRPKSNAFNSTLDQSCDSSNQLHNIIDAENHQTIKKTLESLQIEYSLKTIDIPNKENSSEIVYILLYKTDNHTTNQTEFFFSLNDRDTRIKKLEEEHSKTFTREEASTTAFGTLVPITDTSMPGTFQLQDLDRFLFKNYCFKHDVKTEQNTGFYLFYRNKEDKIQIERFTAAVNRDDYIKKFSLSDCTEDITTLKHQVLKEIIEELISQHNLKNMDRNKQYYLRNDIQISDKKISLLFYFDSVNNFKIKVFYKSEDVQVFLISNANTKSKSNLLIT